MSYLVFSLSKLNASPRGRSFIPHVLSLRILNVAIKQLD